MSESPQALGSGRLSFADEKDVDNFVAMLERFEDGALSPDDWRAFRLVNGVYGQRQDDVMMIRVKFPQGNLNADQLDALAEVAEKYATGRGHLTTRQNMQFHFVKLSDAETALRRLADVGLTTKEACGNAVRNITASPYAGIDENELFDVTPYGQATTRHLLRGPYSSTLPRKFKIAFAGNYQNDDIQAAINDLAFLARIENGQRGWKVLAGGGLSTLRRSGVLVHEFVPVEETLEIAEAMVRTFHRIGNRKDKHKARLKWAIQKLGYETFMAEYRKDREAVAAEGGRPLSLPAQKAAPLPPEPSAVLAPALPEYERFAKSNVRKQKQPGFSAVSVRLVLGDASAEQLRALGRLARTYAEGELRATNEQNIIIPFVANWRLPALHRELVAVGLGKPDAFTIGDVVACPGAMSCKLAVTASRGLASLLTDHLEAHPELAEKAPDLSIKISGCPNGCGQHYSGGIGFQGGVRKVDGKAVPQYFLYVGGGFDAEGAKFGRLAAKIPARRVPVALERLLELYAREKSGDEKPEVFFQRVEVAKVQALVKDLTEMEPAAATSEDFVDLGETQAFEVVLQEGECAA
jgi:sulfite reductase (NADPH) hemoprotein beta-component